MLIFRCSSASSRGGVVVFTQGLSPFLRRLILSTLLDEERVMVHCQLTNSVPFNRNDARPGASFRSPAVWRAIVQRCPLHEARRNHGRREGSGSFDRWVSGIVLDAFCPQQIWFNNLWIDIFPQENIGITTHAFSEPFVLNWCSKQIFVQWFKWKMRSTYNSWVSSPRFKGQGSEVCLFMCQTVWGLRFDLAGIVY
jgi:hypothetical protein